MIHLDFPPLRSFFSRFHRSAARLSTLIVGLASLAIIFHASSQAAGSDSPWPEISRQQKPWAYWWWMGSAVDPANITRELTRYHNAGMGGVHIIPIYGAKGWETNYIDYLSPRWMEMLRHTVAEANRLDLGIDMTTGTGWCFGGPKVTDDEANASVVVKTFDLAAGERLQEVFNRKTVQALIAFSPEGKPTDLTQTISAEGNVAFSPSEGTWHVYAVSQKPSPQKVKRAAPGGEGWMLNLFYPAAMTNYLNWFEQAFANYSGPKPRAQYNDSYEYRSDWAPDLFQQFEKRRGYRLQDELPALFGREETERAGRVKSDYRLTISEMMSEVTLPLWVKWSHDHGFITRNEAHGSPGNLLDLYAVADIPETEMFHADRNKLVSKFASSAAHVAGHPLCSSETGTWLEEHFTETLADMKYLLDDLFLSGVNHIFYHGTCYSPDEAGWPGWVFYASFEMNPRNSVWHDVPALNAYAARCQSVLQSGKPDNDILLYWPIHDRWSSPTGLVQTLTVHARDWFEDQPMGKAAEWLWNHGYQFDYISDHQLAGARASGNRISVAGGNYRIVVVPRCNYMPLETLSNLVSLAKGGATVIFQDQLPKDVPGLGDLKHKQEEFSALLAATKSLSPADAHSGSVIVNSLQNALDAAHVPRESLFDQAGLMCIRRALSDGHYYFVANRGDKSVNGWLKLAGPSQSVVLLDPMTGRSGAAMSRNASDGSEVYLQLEPGESVILRLLAKEKTRLPAWNYRGATGSRVALKGSWEVRFVQGGPQLPPPFQMQQPDSWTKSADTNAQRFAGTAIYSTRFDAPTKAADRYWLDLGKVCQSARVRLNGTDLGTLFTPPFRLAVGKLKPKDNLLEIEVTNVSANRIRDLDRRGVPWKNFRDINFVNLNYRPFDASNWPLTDSGLLGPVTVAAVETP
jgi:hypothetical protein